MLLINSIFNKFSIDDNETETITGIAYETEEDPCPEGDLDTIRSTISPYLYPFVIEVMHFMTLAYS
jgi:hypothetical protein